MKDVVIIIPILDYLQNNRTDELIAEFMAQQVEKLIEVGALKGNLDDIIKDYYFDEGTNYINITVPSEVLGLTNELELVGAAECPTYKVPNDMLSYVDAATGEVKQFSTATINERLRIAMRGPKLRFRYTILDYKRYYKQNESKLKADPKKATKFRNMFLTDIMGMFTEVLPMIEEGKQLAILVGTSQVTPKLNKNARELSLAYRKALRMEKASGQINKSLYGKLKKAYTEFMQILMDQVFPGLNEAQEAEEVPNDGARDSMIQRAASKTYSTCADGRIDLYAEPTVEQMERQAEEDALTEETRALDEDLEHYEEESQKEYSGPELGENMYIVAKFVTRKSDVYYIEPVSEMSQYWRRLDNIDKNHSFIDGEWTIYKLSDAVSLPEALKLLKKQGVKTFSTSRIPVHRLSQQVADKLGVNGKYIAVTAVNLIPHDNKMDLSFRDQRFKNFEDAAIKAIPELTKGSSAKSEVETKKLAFIIDDSYKLVNIVLAPDDFKLGGVAMPIAVNFSKTADVRKEAKRLFKIFDPKATDAEIEKLIDFGLGLAADPEDLIESLKENIKQSGKTFSFIDKDDYYVVAHQNGVVDSWFGPYFHNEAEKVEDEVAYELDPGFSVGIWNLDTLLSKLNKQRKGNYDAKLVEAHADKRNFSESREKVSAEMLEKAKTDGVIQKKPNGSWGIISIDAGEWWTPDYESKEKAENALAAYHANK